MRTARIKGNGGDCYHCMSRVIERRFVLGEVEKEVFRRMLRACEAFHGVRVLTYALMSNHFHILVEVPPRAALSDGDLLRRLGALYTKGQVREIARELKVRRAVSDRQAELYLERYRRRMEDVSEFLKTLKQRFTQWYNRRHGRRGTLWEERFKSVLVEGRGNVLATMAAYIDLNPVRAGLVADPKDYRFGGYGEAVGGSRRAREGLGRVMESLSPSGAWSAVNRMYREKLYVSGEQTSHKAGFTPEQINKVLSEGGALPRGVALRCRVRYFSDGAVLGSRAFVEGVFRAHREYFGSRRRTGARPMKGADWDGLCTARALRLSPLTLNR